MVVVVVMVVVMVVVGGDSGDGTGGGGGVGSSFLGTRYRQARGNARALERGCRRALSCCPRTHGASTLLERPIGARRQISERARVGARWLRVLATYHFALSVWGFPALLPLPQAT